MFPSAGAPCGIVIWGAGRTQATPARGASTHPRGRIAAGSESAPRHCTHSIKITHLAQTFNKKARHAAKAKAGACSTHRDQRVWQRESGVLND